jgi:universal stress protein E
MRRRTGDHTLDFVLPACLWLAVSGCGPTMTELESKVLPEPSQPAWAQGLPDAYPRAQFNDPRLRALAQEFQTWALGQRSAGAAPAPLFSRVEVQPTTRTVLPYGVGAYQQEPRLPVILTTGAGWPAQEPEEKEAAAARAYRKLSRALDDLKLDPPLRPTLTIQTPSGLELAWINDRVEGRKNIHGDELEDEAGEVLAELVRQASESGVAARGVFVRGNGWLELVSEAVRESHDLVLVGNRTSSGARTALLGNTGKKVLRRCPSPVWVQRPEPSGRLRNILVASDLEPVSETALGLAVGLAQVADATVHVLHAIDYPVYHLWLTALPHEAAREYHRRILAHAKGVLHDQLERTDHRTLAEPVRVHVADRVGSPDEVILKSIREYEIDLLVMGTMGRAGIPGALIGNTAERVLPEMTCSVLAVKPPGFRCSIRLS